MGSWVCLAGAPPAATAAAPLRPPLPAPAAPPLPPRPDVATVAKAAADRLRPPETICRGKTVDDEDGDGDNNVEMLDKKHLPQTPGRVGGTTIAGLSMACPSASVHPRAQKRSIFQPPSPRLFSVAAAINPTAPLFRFEP